MLYLFIFFFMLAYFCFNIATLPYNNPYKLIMLFGKKGSGKSTFLARKAVEAQRKGRTVYSNVSFPGVILLRDNDLGYIHLDPDSVVLWDEAGMLFDNRNFKNFKPAVRDWFKLQRHYRCTVYLASQTFDVDKKLRDLCDEMYLIERRFKIFSYGKKILRKTTLLEAKGDTESKIVDNLVFDSFLWFWAGSRIITLIPRYAPLFDSFEAPPLPVESRPVDVRTDKPLSRLQVLKQLFGNLIRAIPFDRLHGLLNRAQRMQQDILEDDELASPEELAAIDFDEFFGHPV